MQISPLNAALMINNIQYMDSSDSNTIIQLIRMTVLSFLALYPANQEFALVEAGVQQRNFTSLVKGKKASSTNPSPPFIPWTISVLSASFCTQTPHQHKGCYEGS